MSAKGFFASRIALAALLAAPALAQAVAVTSTVPASNANNVARDASIVVHFDRAIAQSSITPSSFRVWGTQSGLKTGSTAYTDGDQTLTFTPSVGFFPGEWVSVQIAHSITGADASSMRAAGYAFQFLARTGAGSMLSTQNGPQISVSPDGHHAQIYGGIATDLNGDGWVDYTAVNEVSSDLRVMLNTADGSGLLEPILEPVTPIGYMASPSTLGDFDGDGLIDIATSNSEDDNVTVAISHGDGYFTPHNIDVGARPRSIAALDFDGDGDLDLAVASEFGSTFGEITLLQNDGNGTFTRIDDFDPGGNGKYGLAAGDMNNDGILDLVVGTADDNDGIGRMMVLLGNGDGTFNDPIPAGGIPAGGYVWKIALGDLNNDGWLDAVTVNSGSHTGSVFLGNGDGTLQQAQIYSFTSSWMLGTTLGDVDGDGDLDWVNSDFQNALWYVMENRGDGTFTEALTLPDQIHQFPAAAASCATLFDANNDGTLDLALADEVDDLVTLMQNDGPAGNGQANVSVAMSGSPDQYTPGEALTYTITVANSGPDSGSTHVVDRLPPAFPEPDAHVTWTCSGSGGASCPASGSGDIDETIDLPAGGQVVFSVTGTVSAQATGTIANAAAASVGGQASDPDTSNNAAAVHTSGVGAVEADAGVTLSAAPTQYTPGAALTYTITVTNAGPSAAASAHVADAFPAAFTGVAWTCVASGGASCAPGGSGNIDDDVSLPVGGQLVYTALGTVAAGTTGVLTDSASVSVGAPASDPNGSNNTAVLQTNPAGLPDQIFKNGFDGA